MSTPDDATLDALAALVRLDLPQACRPGVLANLELLAGHAPRRGEPSTEETAP